MKVDTELAKAGLNVKSLFVDGRDVHQNTVAKLHADFRCKRCGTVYDVPIEESDAPKFRGNIDRIVSETIVCYLGICNKCVENTGAMYHH